MLLQATSDILPQTRGNIQQRFKNSQGNYQTFHVFGWCVRSEFRLFLNISNRKIHNFGGHLVPSVLENTK